MNKDVKTVVITGSSRGFGFCQAKKFKELGFNVECNPPSMIGEDFSRYLKAAPGALFRIGTGGGRNGADAFPSDRTGE